ncbi:MAG: peptidoglycan-binding domain-containing protein [Patescibacteria group bacterium]
MIKKIVSVVVALALALTIVAPVATSAQVMTTSAYTFSSNLTIGSRGADVVALQTFLESKGLLTIPAGVAKGYFGALTRSAVSAYQSMKGITPTAGYFGAITRAAVQADMAGGIVSTPGCSAGAIYNSVTGQPCAGQSTVPGCSAGAAYNSVTGQPCSSTNTTPVTSGVEGSLTVSLAATPTNNANVQTSTDVPVYGIEFKGKIAQSVVQTVDLQVAVTLSGSAENPSTLINTIKVWDGSNVIATVPVTSTTFTKDSNQVYYVRLSGLNFVVPVDSTKVLTVSFSTNSIDSDRVVTIDGYGSSSVRAVSGNNISSFYSIDGSAYTRTHTFKKPGTATLTLSSAASPLRSQNYRVNTTDSVVAPVLNFNVKSETGASKILTVNATSSLTGVNGSDLVFYLYDGSTLLSSKTGSTSVSFDNLSVTVGQDVTKTLSVKIGFPATSTGSYIASTSVTSVVYEKPNGSSATVSTAVNGVNQYVFVDVAQFVLASTPTIAISGTNTSGSSTALVATFTFNVTALGGTMLQASSSDFTVKFGTTSADATSVGVTKSVVTIPNNAIADGSTAQVTLTAQLPSASVPQSGLYNAAVVAIGWTVDANTQLQTWGLDDFKTSAAANFIK